MSSVQFIERDFWSSLFPMQTNLLVQKAVTKELSDYLYRKVLDEKCLSDNFQPQLKVLADKPNGHLRRTAKLDPVAEYFIYDLIYRNRSIFRKAISDSRSSYGYRFSDGSPISVSHAFKDFKSAVNEAKSEYKFHLSFDIASYFNSLYHHDLSHWFESFDTVADKDKKSFGKFLREINAGRSVDVLPHGIYPTKMIGSEFLKFVDGCGQLRSAKMIRFMDDFHVFDDDETIVRRDFSFIQKLLGAKGLNVNPSKTKVSPSDVAAVVSEIRKTLFEIVEIEIEEDNVFGSGTEIQTHLVEVEKKLSRRQIKRLLELLREETLDENDAELILNMFRNNAGELKSMLPELWKKFPSLSKSLYAISLSISERAAADIVLDVLDSSAELSEFQLFWLTTLTEQKLLATDRAGRIMPKLHTRTSTSIIAASKLLEIPENRFGMKEIREDHLKNGSSGWQSWAAAVGSRNLKKAARNYSLEYFSKCSPMNHLIALAVKAQP